MKKLLISLALLICPIAYSFGQLSVSGLAGSDGYSVLRATFNADVPFVPGLSIVPRYSLLEQDNKSAMSQYGIGLNFRLPFIDLIEIGADGSYIPKANGYSNYSYDIHGSINIETLLFRLLPTDELKVGLGVRNIYHSFYGPDYNVDESDIYTYIYQKTGGLDTTIEFTKAVSYSGDTSGTPPWLDVPNFTAIYTGYLDYSLGLGAGYTYKFIRPYAAYNFLKIKNASGTDDLKLGVIINVMKVDFNASVEWLNFSKNTDDRKTFYSLTAGVAFL